MKTTAKLAVLFPLVAAACGGVTNPNQQELESECTYTLPANADALHMQRALNAALEGSFDPCGGAVQGGPAVHVALQHVDVAVNAQKQQLLSLVFSVAPARNKF
jgi:hypothetical protein